MRTLSPYAAVPIPSYHTPCSPHPLSPHPAAWQVVLRCIAATLNASLYLSQEALDPDAAAALNPDQPPPLSAPPGQRDAPFVSRLAVGAAAESGVVAKRRQALLSHSACALYYSIKVMLRCRAVVQGRSRRTV